MDLEKKGSIMQSNSDKDKSFIWFYKSFKNKDEAINLKDSLKNQNIKIHGFNFEDDNNKIN